MTLSIPFFTTLRAFFFNQARQQAANATAIAPAPAANDGMVKLPRMIVIVGHRAGNSKGIQLMATEVGNNKIVFRSSMRIREGEMISIEMLLQGHGTFKAMAKVEWVLSSNKSFTGQLVLWSARPEQRRALEEFTARQRTTSR